jgi:pyruvate dehydrogenase E2 component (dihydrolipoamide acetyltransferase)
MVAVTLAELGESVTEGTVIRWLKKVGDEVAVGEPLLEVSTDKVDTEIPSPVAGTLLAIAVGEDETVAVGAELATIGDAAGSPGAGARGAGPTYTTPVVRALAAEHGIDLTALTGTGLGGRIRKDDVLAVVTQRTAGESAPAPARDRDSVGTGAARRSSTGAPAAQVTTLRGTTEKLSRLRTVIAERMVASLQASAQLTTVVEVDVTRIAKLRDGVKREFAAREGVALSFLPFFARAAVEALGQHPKLNASIAGDEVTYHPHVNLGIAVDTERGLLVPVVTEATDLGIAGLARRIADLAERTRASKISADELGGGTFTVTNTGSRGALFDTPIVNQPQVAILGVGAVVRRPCAVVGAEGVETVAIRSMAYLSLSYDHRLVDGADAARYLAAVKARLEEGAFEVR